VPRRLSREQRKAAFLERATQMFEHLEDWYDQHPDASFADIEEEARQQRRALMGDVLPVLINGRDTGQHADPPRCSACAQPVRFAGYRPKQVSHLDGESTFERAYYVCSACPEQTFFPVAAEVASGWPGLAELRPARFEVSQVGIGMEPKAAHLRLALLVPP
jgi:hypothetical protein